MLIPHTQLSTEALDDLLADYVTREGTDNGTFTTQAERKAQLLKSLEREEAFITYNYEHQQPCLIASHQATPESIKDFASLKLSLAEDKRDSLEKARLAEVHFAELLLAMTTEGVFPIDLGRTVMTREVGFLIEEKKVSLEQLQDILRKHSMGDYGVLGIDDKLANLKAIQSKSYMLSRYEVSDVALYVEMYAGHDRTMVMLRSER